MLTDQDAASRYIITVSELLRAEGNKELHALCEKGEITIEQTDYDNWNGGTSYYTVYVHVGVKSFVQLQKNVGQIESAILEKFEIACRHLVNEHIGKVSIVPVPETKVDFSKLSTYTADTLKADIQYLKNMLLSTATGGADIKVVNAEYEGKYKSVSKALAHLSVPNPNPYRELWEWYGHFKNYSTYAQRRIIVNDLFSSLLDAFEENPVPMVEIAIKMDGWEKITRTVNEIKNRDLNASSEEQYQAVGLLCRDVLVSLAQEVFIKEKHPIVDGTVVSTTDAKRMLEAFIAVELGGSSNESLRKVIKGTNDLANELTHKRSAEKRHSSLCVSSTISLINLIGIIAGKH